jgi:hypothetical protein
MPEDLMETPLHARPAADEYAPFYHTYVSLVPAGDLLALLEDQRRETASLLAGLSEEAALHRYEPGKWSVKEVVGHVADTERVMLYRALRAARGDRTPLPGFDENAYVAAAGFDARPLGDLLAELGVVREATLRFLRGLPPQAWTRRVEANGHEVSVRALACIVAGHELHHLRLLRGRYLGPSASGG